MKKFLNNPQDLVSEFIDGLVFSRKDLRRLGDLNCVVKAKPTPHRVGLVSLGGSGHEPAHAGYIGPNGLDGVACGQIFASPSVEQICKTAEAVHTGSGILFIVKNYKGDNLNTDMAMEILQEKKITSKKVVITDDVSPIAEVVGEKVLERRRPIEERRGVAGTCIVHKMLGAAARGYNSLEVLYQIGLTLNRNLKTMGAAVAPCVIPTVGSPNFSLPEGHVAVGIGIHGEPGIKTVALGRVDPLVDELVGYIVEDFKADDNPLNSKNGVIAMVNGMGGTSLIELYAINKRLRQQLDQLGIKVVKNPVGNFMTSLEMAGFSITILKLHLDLIPFIHALEDLGS